MGASQGKERPQHQSTPTGAKVATAKPVAAQQTISGQCTHECSYAPRLEVLYYVLPIRTGGLCNHWSTSRRCYLYNLEG